MRIKYFNVANFELATVFSIICHHNLSDNPQKLIQQILVILIHLYLHSVQLESRKKRCICCCSVIGRLLAKLKFSFIRLEIQGDLKVG